MAANSVTKCRFLIISGLLSVAFAGCSALGPSIQGAAPAGEALEKEKQEASQPAETARISIEQLRKESEREVPGLEILFEVPSLAPEAFLIHYGYSRDNLNFEQKIPVAELVQVEHPQFGTVYRYVLENIPPDKTVYLSLSSMSGSEILPPGQVFEVEPLRQERLRVPE